MFALVFGAVRARAAQALTIAVLTALATAAGVAGPWFAPAATSRAAAAVVDAAPIDQRMISVRQRASTVGEPEKALAAFRTSVQRHLPFPDDSAVLGMTIAMSIDRGEQEPPMSVAYREGFCTHVEFTGSCPDSPGEVAISRSAAQSLGIELDDPLILRSTPTSPEVDLRVVARYEQLEPGGPYWSNPLFRADTDGSGGYEPVFTTPLTFADRQLWEATLTYDTEVPNTLIQGVDGYDLAAVLEAGDSNLDAVDLNLVDPTAELLAGIDRDASAIRLGVVVGLLLLMLLFWFALGLAGRYTGRERRADIALMKLRGSSRSSILRLALGQHLAPMLAGALIGAPAGFFTARLLVGAVTGRADVRTATWLSAAAIGAVLVGGLLILLLVELSVLRQPVASLLRRVPPGRRDWRADAVDVLLLAVAAAAVYQVRAGAGTAVGLTLIAPALVALAVALLLARLLGRVADRGGAVALKAGRLRLGLTALQISRQPGTYRVFALVVVAVAMLATAAGGWSAGATARTDRSSVELGASRVLTVQATGRIALLDAVRRADPEGRYAMAAVVNRKSSPPVLAVDTERLAAVAPRGADFGDVGVLTDALATDAPVPPLPPVTGGRLTLAARNDSPGPVAVVAQLENEVTGAPVAVTFGPIPRGVHQVPATVTGCTTTAGCRLVRWELLLPVGSTGRLGNPLQGTDVTITGLTQQAPAVTVLDPASLADVRRWRPEPSGAALSFAASDGALRLTVTEDTAGGQRVVGNELSVADVAVPLPVVLVGTPPQQWQLGEPMFDPFGGGKVPVRVTRTAVVLPVVGRAGVLMDLRTTQRVTTDAGFAGTMQVWLAPDTPATVVTALRDGGLIRISDDSQAVRAHRLAQQGPAVAVWFRLLLAGIGLLLAAAAMAVAAEVDREPRLTQLGALRTQGLSRAAAIVVAYAGQAALVVTGVLGGMLAAVVADRVVQVAGPQFTDGWEIVDPPTALPAVVLLAAGLGALLVLGLTGWLSAAPLIRRLREPARESR